MAQHKFAEESRILAGMLKADADQAGQNEPGVRLQFPLADYLALVNQIGKVMSELSKVEIVKLVDGNIVSIQ